MPTLTVIGGDLKGANLQVPDDPKLRPTLARVRGAVCDIWQFRMEDARLLDGFAGSGMMGLEAISRGAARVVSLESSRTAVQRIRESWQRIAKEREVDREDFARWEVRQESVEQGIEHLIQEGAGFDLIYLDPPYGYTGLTALIPRILASGLLDPEGELMIECADRDRRMLPSAGIRKEHRHGGTLLVRYGSTIPAQ